MEDCAHKTSLIPPLFIEVLVPSQESEQSCIWVEVIDFYDFSIRFCNCFDRVLFFW